MAISEDFFATDKERLQFINDMADILATNPYLSDRDLSRAFECSVAKISYARKYVTEERLEEAKKRLDLPEADAPGALNFVKPFVPTAERVTVKGKSYWDVSEWFGITEYGGRCYAK